MGTRSGPSLTALAPQEQAYPIQTYQSVGGHGAPSFFPPRDLQWSSSPNLPTDISDTSSPHMSKELPKADSSTHSYQLLPVPTAPALIQTPLT